MEAKCEFGADLWVGATHGNAPCLRSKDGALIATMARSGADTEIAAEIARRWNAYPAFLAACEAFVKPTQERPTPYLHGACVYCRAHVSPYNAQHAHDCPWALATKAIEAARSALALARGAK